LINSQAYDTVVNAIPCCSYVGLIYRPLGPSYQHLSILYATEFATYSKVGKFAISFRCPNAQKLSASGAASLPNPHRGFPAWGSTVDKSKEQTDCE